MGYPYSPGFTSPQWKMSGDTRIVPMKRQVFECGNGDGGGWYRKKAGCGCGCQGGAVKSSCGCGSRRGWRSWVAGGRSGGGCSCKSGGCSCKSGGCGGVVEQQSYATSYDAEENIGGCKFNQGGGVFVSGSESGGCKCSGGAVVKSGCNCNSAYATSTGAVYRSGYGECACCHKVFMLALVVMLFANPLLGIIAFYLAYKGKSNHEKGMVYQSRRWYQYSWVASILGIIVTAIILAILAILHFQAKII